MGSEMCIRDSKEGYADGFKDSTKPPAAEIYPADTTVWTWPSTYTCLLYTSDAADERSSVDLGGRRIIKKKNIRKIIGVSYNN